MSRSSSTPSLGLGHYLVTWLVLMALGALSFGLSEASLGEPWSMVLTLFIAMIKAGLIALVFMHLAAHRGSVRVAAATGLGFVTLLVLLTTLDAWSRS